MLKLSPVRLGSAAVASVATDLFASTQPGLTPAVVKVMNVLAKGGSNVHASQAGLAEFGKSAAGKSGGARALKAVAPILSQVVKHPLVAQQWNKLVQFAAKPGAFKPLTQVLVKTVGRDVGTVLGTYQSSSPGLADWVPGSHATQ